MVGMPAQVGRGTRAGLERISLQGKTIKEKKMMRLVTSQTESMQYMFILKEIMIFFLNEVMHRRRTPAYHEPSVLEPKFINFI